MHLPFWDARPLGGGQVKVTSAVALPGTALGAEGGRQQSHSNLSRTKLASIKTSVSRGIKGHA